MPSPSRNWRWVILPSVTSMSLTDLDGHKLCLFSSSLPPLVLEGVGADRSLQHAGVWVVAQSCKCPESSWKPAAPSCVLPSISSIH